MTTAYVEATRVKKAFVNVAAAQTDAAVIAAVSGRKLRVVQLSMTGNTATGTATFNTKPGGAGSAISPAFTMIVGGVLQLDPQPEGWFQTNAGEGLSITTTTDGVNILVGYIEMT